MSLGKKLPYNRQIVYPQVYDLPLIGGYKIYGKDNRTKESHSESLRSKKIKTKSFLGFVGCRLILELAASYVGIHICGSFAVFECLSGKKPPRSKANRIRRIPPGIRFTSYRGI